MIEQYNKWNKVEYVYKTKYLLSEEPPFWLRKDRKRGELTS